MPGQVTTRGRGGTHQIYPAPAWHTHPAQIRAQLHPQILIASLVLYSIQNKTPSRMHINTTKKTRYNSTNMANRKRGQSQSPSSQRSLSSPSDAAIKGGRKAKQVAIKTVKSLTALIKKPCKSCTLKVNVNFFFLCNIRNIYLYTADTEPERVVDNEASITHTSSHAPSMMDIDASLTRTSSQAISISSSNDDNTKEEKIIKEIKNKISKLSAQPSVESKTYLFC